MVNSRNTKNFHHDSSRRVSSFPNNNRKDKINLDIKERGKIDHLNISLKEGRYTIFDIETTGGNPERNGITEIFALRFHNGEVIDTFYSMVNPKVRIPPIVRRMTGITDKMVRDAPSIECIMPRFVDFIENDICKIKNTNRKEELIDETA